MTEDTLHSMRIMKSGIKFCLDVAGLQKIKHKKKKKKIK